jgi:ankyrin repeat protein
MDMQHGGRELMVDTKAQQVIKAILGMALCLVFVNCAGNRPVGQRDMDMRLIRACETGSSSEVKNLIRQGADINATNKDGWTPYLAASSNGNFEAMKVLKSLGAKTSTYLEEGPLAIR